MIVHVWFDDLVIVHKGKSLGEGMGRADERAPSFHAADGWDIREILPYSGVFSLYHEGMPYPVTIGGYGYSYVRTDPQEESEDATEIRKLEEDYQQERRDGDAGGQAEEASRGDRVQQGSQEQAREMTSRKRGRR